MPSSGSSPAGTRRAPRGGPSRERRPARLPPDPAEPIQFLLRIPPPAPGAARGHVRRVRVLPDRGRRGGRGRGPGRPAEDAGPLAPGDRVLLRGRAGGGGDPAPLPGRSRAPEPPG